MTAALLARAERVSDSQRREARSAVVGAASAWVDTFDHDGHRLPAADGALVAAVRRYDRLTDRWLRLSRAATVARAVGR
jgi:hypothetical protein